MLERLAMGAIMSLMEKFREKKRDLYVVFIGLGQLMIGIPREVIWHVLKKKQVNKHYSMIIVLWGCK